MQPINHCSSSSPTRDIAMSDRNAAIELLYQEYHAPLYRRIYALTRNHEQAQDIIQETFLKVCLNVSKLKYDGNVRSWLYRIATNTFYDSKRKDHTHPSTISLDDEEALELVDHTDHFTGVALRELMKESLPLLTRIQREAFSAWIEHYYYSPDQQQVPEQKHKAWRARKQFKHLYKALESVESA